VSRFPIAPPLLPDEAISSWIARIAARYDLSAEDLISTLVPTGQLTWDLDRRIDYEAIPHLEAALRNVVGKPDFGFGGQRVPGFAANPKAAWRRKLPAWCPVCVSHDIARSGETYGRREWGFGGLVMCPEHKCLLVCDCPRCLKRACYQPIGGRLRIWCVHCETLADSYHSSSDIPFRPYGTPQQHRSCVTVALLDGAVPLLLRLQSELIAALAGAKPKGPWMRRQKHWQLSDVLNKLSFVMLGPLWEGHHRYELAPEDSRATWVTPKDWSPGSLPPEIAAPALLASAAFLAAESLLPVRGISWNPVLLLDGEREEIDAESLAWHLNSTDRKLVKKYFATPHTRPFAWLLGVLGADRNHVGAAREETRRRAGLGGAGRRYDKRMLDRAKEDDAARKKRKNWELAYRPKERFDISKLIGGPPAREPPEDDPSLEAKFAVYGVLGSRHGWFESRAEPFEMMSRDITRLSRSRYVWFWVHRHSILGPEILVALLKAADDSARAENRDIVLPELSEVGDLPKAWTS
jgi:hypothetical protein